jgi:methylenetetrahydrofolate reductase (NADPH)
MHIRDLLTTHQPSLSFEFFPARTPEAAASLYATIADLEELKPAFVSVTYGAGGTTRELTHNLVERIKETTMIPPVPHLTCVGHTRDDIRAILRRYAAKGIGNVLALRGDPPRNQPDYAWADGAFAHASDLVSFIKEFNQSGEHPDPRGFGIGVAGFPEGHPATPNRLVEIDHLKAKVDAGADYICTQLFFDNRDFLDFRDRCDLAGIRVPIIAGIMPVVSIASMQRMAELAGGTRFPATLIRALQNAGSDPAAVERAGIDFAAAQCQDLLTHGVTGLHLYTLNKSQATREICHRLGIAGC